MVAFANKFKYGRDKCDYLHAHGNQSKLNINKE
jgi:hypothetical protein